MDNKENRRKKVNHRGHNEGSCYQRKDGKWMGQIQIGFKPNGTRKFITKTARTKQEIKFVIYMTLQTLIYKDFVIQDENTIPAINEFGSYSWIMSKSSSSLFLFVRMSRLYLLLSLPSPSKTVTPKPELLK